MKKILYFSLFISLITMAFAFSKKMVDVKRELTAKQSGFLWDKSVNEYGFLAFDSIADVEQYLDVVRASTHAEIQEILSGLSFTSLGTELYPVDEYGNQTVTEEQAENYMLNANKIFQVQNVIFKPIGDTNCSLRYKFILAMSESNLNAEIYEKLAAGEFEGEVMNKFATNATPEGGVFNFQFYGRYP
jgi:hypothetical protein